MRKDYTGQKFGRLTILCDDNDIINNQWIAIRRVKCKCKCWGIKTIRLVSVINNLTKSCWCLADEARIKLKTTHWLSKTKIWETWMGIKVRCLNKLNYNYKNYWGRWIKVCDEWLKFEWFYKDMWSSYKEHIKKYWEKDTSIDRIDNNWNYCKDNCRWATVKEQANNRRNNHLLTYKWKTMNISWWSDFVWIRYWTLANRIINLKWSIEKSIETSVRHC